jgi:hypothetical protein
MALKRNTPLRSTKPLAPMSAQRMEQLRAAGLPTNSTLVPRQRANLDRQPRTRQRRQPAVPVDVRDELMKRAGEGFWCEIQMSGCWGRGTDPSHRITVKSGGRRGAAKERHDRLSDVLWACRACHDWCHRNPAAAKAETVGWMLEEWQNPAECPVLYRGRLCYLDDGGGVHDFEQVGA